MRARVRVFAIAAASALLAFSVVTSSATAPQAAPPAPVKMFEGARLVTGDGSAPVDDSAFVVTDGRIARVGSRTSLKVPKGAEVVDLSGKTVIPMLIDVHGHIGYMRGETIAKENYSKENILDQLRRLEYYGVAVLLSLGTDRNDLELQIRNEQRSGKLNDPEIALLLTADDGIVPNNNGAPNGGPAFAEDVVHEVATPEQARQFVREEVAKGADMIKFWDDDRNHTKPKMTQPIYRAIIEEARANRIQSVAHTFYLDDSKGIAAAGVSGLAHPVRDQPIDDEFLKVMKEHDVFQCSNLSPMAPRSWLDNPALRETVPAAAIEAFGNGPENANAKVYSMAQKSERMESDAGIRIVLCGDTGGVPGQFPGFSEHRELQALVGAGIAPLKVIQDVTQISAQVLGLDDRGTLVAGRRADFIVLDANPLDDISNTLKIAAIYKSGRAIDRKALRERIASAWAR